MPEHPASVTYKNAADQTPEAAYKRLIETYEIAIRAGVEKNTDLAQQAITLLASTIDPTPNPDLAISLRGVYTDCERFIEAEDWANYCEYLERLKGLWSAYNQVRNGKQ